MIDIKELKSELKYRRPISHKGDYGKDLIIAGSEYMAGAAILSSKAALRSGAGLVYVSCTKEMIVPLHVSVPEAVLVDRSLSNLDIYDAILIGPGLGNTEDTRNLLLKVLKEYKGPIVLDADGINVISEFNLYDDIRNYPGEIVLTPHEGEAYRLSKMRLERVEEAEYLSNLVGHTIVLKGNGTIVINKEKVYINTTGNPGMATAGSGDTLSGIILSLIGQGIDTFKSACLGTYIHGKAGDLVKDKIGEDGIIASDIIEAIPLVLKSIKEK